MDGDQVTQEASGRERDEAQRVRARESQARAKAGSRARARGEAAAGAEEICSTMAGSSRSSGSCERDAALRRLQGTAHKKNIHIIICYDY